ncbi:MULTISPECIES: Rrf2 family transcriptional regulator [unclassified Acidiphilium]|uniref:RrF2 family transcriptional regulator n=1 Tax=unclassified Acidiphilium TaxID=2617493 RepID=UPI000BDCAA20|nr:MULTISPECIES: Rrf2 family transcriptional regulator [unclassified Acidiphilium]OYV54929.1 MAG: Rrf2 family transcriptional regulator [Acidiphilium sp. 20-67-58]OYV82703.1 MAG: Rrf2 family transcriptional regulator [Acidiphilium sp. 21-68-69]HQT61637.1 Rrf2 family transcriptional regulator [Acidiphilium sp.]
MHLTMFTDYGLRALIFLALRPDDHASIPEVASAYGISENHLTKVAHALGQKGLVETIRGRNGGMRLARPAERIGLGEVVRAMEPSLALVTCQEGGACAIGGCCGLHGVMNEAQAALLAVFDRYTLADVVTPGDARLLARLGIAPPPPR